MKKEMLINEKLSVGENPEMASMKGHVIFRDPETGKILHEEDNLVLMRTRIFLFEHLFGIDAPDSYTPGKPKDNTRTIALWSAGSGGADVNASSFTPFVPTFGDTALGQSIPFIIQDPDKNNNTETQANPSIVESLTPEQTKTYYMDEVKSDGTTAYYAKRFKAATDDKPLGDSIGWKVDQNSGLVSFSLSMQMSEIDCRGLMFNEIGLWLAKFDSKTNKYTNPQLATRLCFSTESLTNLTKTIDIEYVIYI